MSSERKAIEQILNKNEITEQEEKVIFDIIPELKDEKKFLQNNPWHIYDVWGHTKKVLQNSKVDVEIRLVLLLHDIGKPYSYQDDENEIRHFRGHSQKSAEISKPILERLGYKEEQIKEMCFLIENHDNPPVAVAGRCFKLSACWNNLSLRLIVLMDILFRDSLACEEILQRTANKGGKSKETHHQLPAVLYNEIAFAERFSCFDPAEHCRHQNARYKAVSCHSRDICHNRELAALFKISCGQRYHQIVRIPVDRVGKGSKEIVGNCHPGHTKAH